MEDGGIADEEGGDVGLVGLLALLGTLPLVAREPPAHDDDGNDDADHTERIGHGATQGRTRGRLSQLLERLLGRTERGGIGRGTAEHAHHIADGHKTAPHNE